MTGPLASRDFRLLFTGQTISLAGSQIFTVALAFAVLGAGGGLTGLGLVLAARTAALVVFVLLAGVVADRVRRTRAMIGSDLVRFLAVGAIAVSLHHLSLAALTTLAVVESAGEAFFQPAFSAVIPVVLPDELLSGGNALNSVAVRSASMLGPAIGGVVVATLGVRAAFGLDALSFLASMLTLVLIKESAARNKSATILTSIWSEAAEGIRAVRDRPWVLAILVMAGLQLMFCVAPITVLSPVLAAEHWGGAKGYGLVIGAFGLGGLVGAFIALKWNPRQPGLVGNLGWLLYALIPLAYIRPLPLGWVIAVQVIAGAGLEPFLVYWQAGLQKDVPRELHARVFSVDYLFSFSLMPLGMALAPVAFHSLGRSPVLVFASIVIVIPTIAVLVFVPGAKEFRTPTMQSRSRSVSGVGAQGR